MGTKRELARSETYWFTGQRYSSAIGLHYYYQLWYDPSIGQFISQDTLAGSISDPQSQNAYVYVQNLPTLSTDPTGAFECDNSVACDAGFKSTGDQNSNAKDPRYSRLCAQNPFICGEEDAATGDPLTVGVVGGATENFGDTAGEAPATVTTSTVETPKAQFESSVSTTGTADVVGQASEIGNQGVRATIQGLGDNFVGTEAPVYSPEYGRGRIDVVSTDRFIEVKNVQSLYLTDRNELQMLKYVDAVGASNLQYDIYANYVSPTFLQALNGLKVAFRLLPYIPVPE